MTVAQLYCSRCVASFFKTLANSLSLLRKRRPYIPINIFFFWAKANRTLVFVFFSCHNKFTSDPIEYRRKTKILCNFLSTSLGVQPLFGIKTESKTEQIYI